MSTRSTGAPIAGMLLLAACRNTEQPPADTSSYDSVRALYADALRLDNHVCTSARLWDTLDDVAKRNLTGQFPEVRQVGFCLGPEIRYLFVFNDGDAREEFVDTQHWVEFARVFYPVQPGRRLSGIAGYNWLITGEHSDLVGLGDLGGRTIRSHPAH